jgi:uncharacterized protein
MDTNLAIIEDTDDMIAANMRHEAEEQFKKRLPLAEQGDAEAQYQLGKLYCSSMPSIPQDELKAWNWHYKAAEQGHPLATAALIFMWIMGGHKYPPELPWTDRESAFQSLIATLTALSNDQSNVVAMQYLGWFNAIGVGCETDYEAATQHFLEGAMLGCPECMAGLGILSTQKDIPINEGDLTAIEWVEKSWSEYCLLAGLWLGQRFLNSGQGDQRRENNRKAISYFQTGAELGCGDAAEKLAECYANGTGVSRSEQAAFHWYKIAADRKNDDALYALARADRYLPTIEITNQQRTTWMEQAATLGNLSAMGEFGHWLIYEDVVERDIERGLDLIRRSANSGDPKSLHILGRLHRDGDHVPQSYDTSTEYFRRSADGGSPRGHLSYGYALLWGEGVAKAPQLASKHFSEAFDAGIFDGSIGLGVADYQLLHDPVRALGFVLFGVREIGGTPPSWITEFIEELTELVDETGMALVEEFCAYHHNRFNQ